MIKKKDRAVRKPKDKRAQKNSNARGACPNHKKK
jgi:hypothetical protein